MEIVNIFRRTEFFPDVLEREQVSGYGYVYRGKVFAAIIRGNGSASIVQSVEFAPTYGGRRLLPLIARALGIPDGTTMRNRALLPLC